jgi:hypothetical protein
MPILPSILNGTAACAGILESLLTMLLYRQVRRYNAGLPRSLPPRKRRPIAITRQHATTSAKPEIHSNLGVKNHAQNLTSQLQGTEP